MSKTIYIVQNKTKKNSSWVEKVSKWTEEFIAYNDTWIVVDNIKHINTSDVIIIGSDMSKNVVSAASKLHKQGKNVRVISNLCCDTSYENFFEGIDKLVNLGVTVNKDFEFAKREVIDFVKKSLELASGRKSEFDDDTLFINIRYDSIDLLNLTTDIEEEYDVDVPTVIFGKMFKVKDLYKILENGQYSLNKYNLK